MTPRPQLLTPSFLWLVAAHALESLAYSSMLLLPLYLAYLGASRTEIGAIMGTSAVGSLLARPLIAWALDSIGRKRTLVFGTAVMVAPMLSFLFVTEVSPLVYALRFVMGAGAGALWTGYFTFASDLIPQARRTEGLALFGIAGMVPLIVNPFADQLGIEPKDLRIFFFAIGLVILFSLIPLAGVKENKRSARVERFRFLAAVKAMREPRLYSVWIGIVALGAIVGSFQSFATVVAESRGIEETGVIWLCYASGAIFVRLTGGRLPDRIGPARLLPPAFLSYAAAAVIAASGTSPVAFGAAGLLAGFGHGFGFPVLTSQVVSRTPEELRGSAVSTLTALWESAALAFNPLFGAIADANGDRAMFHAAAAMIAGSLLIWWPLERRSRLSPTA